MRVDRIELSKNILRGFHAFDELLTLHPEWRGNVVFGALLYPSREGLPEYLAYRQEVEGLVERLNCEVGDGDVDTDPVRRERRLPSLDRIAPASGRRARQPDP